LNERLFTRAQSLLRSFFGLGPSQFSLSDTIVPTIDVDMLMRSSLDLQLTTATSAAIAPGSITTTGLPLPIGSGMFQLMHLSLDTQGPATSGTFRMGANSQHNQAIWGINASMSLIDTEILYTKIGVPAATQRRSARFDKPPIFNQRAAGGSDTLLFSGINDAASVGNMTVTATAMWRIAEPVLNQ
jgi:hypothetical protein